MNTQDQFGKDPDHTRKPKNKKPKLFLDEEKRDLNKLNKSFKQRKREISEEDDDWKNWEDYVDR